MAHERHGKGRSNQLTVWVWPACWAAVSRARGAGARNEIVHRSATAPAATESVRCMAANAHLASRPPGLLLRVLHVPGAIAGSAKQPGIHTSLMIPRPNLHADALPACPRRAAPTCPAKPYCRGLTQTRARLKSLGPRRRFLARHGHADAPRQRLRFIPDTRRGSLRLLNKASRPQRCM